MGATRSPALNVMDFRGLSINTAETAITIVASDSGTIFVQNYATACTYTLPDVTTGAGKMFMIVNLNTATSTVITSTTALIKGTYTAGAAKTTLTSVAVGDAAIIIGDGSYWYFINLSATGWTITT